MNESEAGRLLTVLAAIDPKLPAPDDAALLRRIWTGLLQDVPFEAAQRAVEAYYRSERYLASREPVSPADIVGHWNARRRPSERERRGHASGPDRTRRRIEAARTGPPATRARVREIMTDLCGQMNWTPTYSVALSTTCPDCGAESGFPCTRHGSGTTAVPVHQARRDAATAATSGEESG